MIGGIRATPGRCLLEVLGQLVENVSKLHEPVDNVLPKTEDKAQRKEFGRRIACLVSKAASAETVSGNQGAGSRAVERLEHVLLAPVQRHWRDHKPGTQRRQKRDHRIGRIGALQADDAVMTHADGREEGGETRDFGVGLRVGELARGTCRFAQSGILRVDKSEAVRIGGRRLAEKRVQGDVSPDAALPVRFDRLFGREDHRATSRVRSVGGGRPPAFETGAGNRVVRRTIDCRPARHPLFGQVKERHHIGAGNQRTVEGAHGGDESLLVARGQHGVDHGRQRPGFSRPHS